MKKVWYFAEGLLPSESSSFYEYSLVLQSTLFISNSKGLTEILRDIRTSTYQSWEGEENNKLNNHI